MLLEEQSDRFLHCLPFCLHRLDALLYGRATLFKFKADDSTFSGVRILKIFTVYIYVLPQDTSFFPPKQTSKRIGIKTFLTLNLED